MCHAIFQLKRLPQLRLWIVTTLFHLDYPRSSTNNPWNSNDAHLQDGTIPRLWMAAIKRHFVLPRKAAITSVMNSSDQVQWFHQSRRSRSAVGLSPVRSNGKVRLDRTTDWQSWTGRAWSGPIHFRIYFWHCSVAKYYRKHDSSSPFITTRPRILTLVEIILLRSVYSAPSRYIFLIKRLLTGRLYPNPGHREGSVWTKPSPVCQHLGSVRSQFNNFLDWTWTGLDSSDLDWSIAGLVESLTRSLFNYRTYRTKNRWRSVDAHFQDGAGSLIPLFLIWKAGNTSFMNGCNQSAVRLHKMHRQKSLMLHGSSFSEGGSDRGL